MYRRLLSHSVAGLGLALSLSACSAPDLGQPCPIPPAVTDPNDPLYKAALDKCFPAMSAQPFDTRLKKDVDILFMIDNSTSMSPKQRQLAIAIPQFIQQIDATGANYHVGVVTSDIGTVPPGGSFAQPDARCNTLKGDDGLLQNLPCSARNQNVSAEFTAACNSLCPDPTFIPQNGQRFISRENSKSKKDAQGKEIGPQLTFQCIGLVGDAGCGVEGQLESVRRALDGHLMENEGFLRPNSVLAVIFITDEDDCSAKLTQRQDLNPADMNCGQTSGDPAASCFNLDYRCIARDLVCNESLAVSGAKTGCKERTDTFLDPTDKFARFLTNIRPDKLVLGAIWSPSIIDFNNGITTPLGNGQLVVASSNGAADTSTNRLNRAERNQAACFNGASGLTNDARGYFGQAQYRLEQFKNRFDPKIWSEVSICDVNNYPTVLNNIAAAITNAVGVDCLGVKPTVNSSGDPTCLVGFVDAATENGLPDSYLPVCSDTCCDAWANSAKPTGPYGAQGEIQKDPAIIAACTPETADCYCAVPSTQGLCTTTAVAGVWRVGNADPPANKVVNFRCAGTRPPQPPTQ